MQQAQFSSSVDKKARLRECCLICYGDQCPPSSVHFLKACLHLESPDPTWMHPVMDRVHCQFVSTPCDNQVMYTWVYVVLQLHSDASIRHVTQTPTHDCSCLL